MFVGEGDQAEVVWECINISDENVESIANRTDEILRQGKSAKGVQKFARPARDTQVKYLTRSRFRLPEVSTKNKSVFECPNNCGSSFFYKHTLDKHLKFICGQPLRYKCPYCDMSSRIRNNLNIHIKARHPDCKNYVIDTCIGKTEPPFEEDFETSHVQHVEPAWNAEHEIKILSVSSLAKSEEIKHEFADFKDEFILKSPSGRNKRYVCPNNCGSSYKHEYTLKVHMEFNCNKHRSEGNPTTDHQNSFHLDEDESDSEGYDVLMTDAAKVENPEELLNPMAFGESSTLRKNVEGKWLCPNKCGSTFSSRGNLNYHLRTNCGLEPKFECPYCSHRMKQLSNGFTHVKNHHPGSEICLVNTDTGEVIRRKRDLVNNQKMNISIGSPEVPTVRRDSSGKVENTCQSCGKEFKFEHTLSRHLSEGCGFPPRFKCPYCEYQVRRLSYAFIHVTKNHPGCEVYMVDLITGDSITDPTQIKKEVIEDIGEEEKPLAPNPAFVSRSKKVVKSRPGGLQKKKLVCPKGCGNYFFFRLSLQKHLRHCKRNKKRLKNKESARFKCPYCESRSAHRSSIFRHVKSHHQRHRRYVIDTHEEEIVPENVDSQALNRNQEKKTQKEISKIEKLPKKSNDLDLEKTEDDSNSVEAPKMFECPNKCGSTFEHSFNVNRHVRDNCAKVRRFKCPQCKYRSHKFMLIEKHIKTNHRMSKVYAHDVFTKQLIDKEPKRRPRVLMKLKKEKTEQANVKPAVAQNLYSDATTLKTVVRRSKVQKRFPCPNNCGSSFSLERYVETHLRLICGKAPRYKCPYCPQICRHQGNITIHIKHRHPGKRSYMIDILKKKSVKVGSKKPRKQKTNSEDLQEEVEKEDLPNESGLNEMDKKNITDDKTSEAIIQPYFKDVPARRKTSKIFNSRKRRIECPHKCGRYFQSVNKLRIHTKSICKRAPLLKCPYCSKVCKHSWNFDMHIKHRHPQCLGGNTQTQQVESDEFRKNDDVLENQSGTGDLMNVIEEIAGRSGSPKAANEVNDEAGQGDNLEVANEIEEMEDNERGDDVEMEVANEFEDVETENLENEDVDIKDLAESNTSVNVSSDAGNLNHTTPSKKFPCPNNCSSSYSNYSSLKSHLRYACQKSPRFKCPYCDNCTKQPSNGYVHVKKMHPGRQIYLIDIETNKFICRSRYHPSKGAPEALENPELQQQNVVQNQNTVENQDAVGVEDIEVMDDSNDEPDEPDEPILGTEEEFGVAGPAASQNSSAEKNKSFICPNNCGSSFTHEYKLTNHVRDQCGPPRYKCPYCFYITRQPSNVYTHIKKKHPDERIYMIDTDMNQSCDEPGSPPGDDEN